MTVPAVAYRFRGVNPKGQDVSGKFAVASNLPALVESYYRQGWRSLSVYSGDGPVPPGGMGDENNLVAGVAPHPDTGERMWWAEG